jgi:hypothetical protein
MKRPRESSEVLVQIQHKYRGCFRHFFRKLAQVSASE